MLPALVSFLFSEPLGDFLAQQPDPESYVVSRTKGHRVVFLGEDHAVKQNLDFAARLIPQLAAAGITNFGMEFGAAEDQAELDALVTAPTYDEDKARKLMFHYNVGWAYLEYQELYRAAWNVNQRRPKNGKPFRILNLSYVFNWPGYAGRYPASMERVFSKGPIEGFRRDVVKKEVLDKGQRIVILTGTPHAFTHFTNPSFNYDSPTYVSFDDQDFGNLVSKLAPKECFTILLHQPYWSADPPGKSVYPADGALDRAFSRPAGFDLGSTPAGQLPDHSWYSLGRPRFRLGDLADGYVMLAPIKSLSGCTVDRRFVTDGNLEDVQKNWPDPDWRPAPKTVSEYYEGVSAFVDLSKRYRSLP